MKAVGPDNNDNEDRRKEIVAIVSNIDKRLITQSSRDQLLARPGEDIEAFGEFYHQLQDNVVAAEAYERMRPLVNEFSNAAPHSLVYSSCMDERTHGEKKIGWPPDVATIHKTAGNTTDLSVTNLPLWQHIDLQMARAAAKGKPILWSAMGHYSETPDGDGHRHNCAAKGNDPEQSLEEVRKQAREANERLGKQNVYSIFGMTNTDNGLETIYLQNGKTEVIVDPKEIINEFGLKSPADMFRVEKRNEPIDDETVRKYIGRYTLHELFSGSSAYAFNDLQTGVAMEYYLLSQMKTAVDPGSDSIYRRDFIDHIVSILDSVKDPAIREEFRVGLAYRIAWNIAHGLFQNERLKTMTEEQKRQQLLHNASVIAGGKGFELKDRNTALLVSINQGAELARDLGTARKVMDHIRETTQQESRRHPPLIHLNIELSDPIQSSQRANRVTAELRSLKDVAEDAYKDSKSGVRILTTYSYTSPSNGESEMDRPKAKVFYPVQLEPRSGPEIQIQDNDMSVCPIDMFGNIMKDGLHFAENLRANETAYVAMMAK